MTGKKLSESPTLAGQRRRHYKLRKTTALSKTRKLTKPEAFPDGRKLTASRWRSIKECLIGLILHHWPEPWPNLTTLADEIGYHVNTVQRCLADADQLGLIERYWREGGRWDAHGYILRYLLDDAVTAPATSHQTGVTSSHQTGARRDTKLVCQVRPHSVGDSKAAPSVTSHEVTSAASPAAAAVPQGQGGIQAKWGDTCVQCRRWREASDLDHGPNRQGWVCKDRAECLAFQAAAKAQAEEDQRQWEQTRLEREQRERERLAYEASPEGIAAAQERAAARQAALPCICSDAPHYSRKCMRCGTTAQQRREAPCCDDARQAQALAEECSRRRV